MVRGRAASTASFLTRVLVTPTVRPWPPERPAAALVQPVGVTKPARCLLFWRSLLFLSTPPSITIQPHTCARQPATPLPNARQPHKLTTSHSSHHHQAAAMPVPVAVTHPKGAGLQSNTPATLETDGPFARLAKAAAAAQSGAPAPAAAATATGEPPQTANGSTQQQPQQQQQLGSTGQQLTVSVNHLDFSYPGLGATPPWWQPVWLTRIAALLAAPLLVCCLRPSC
jgi:hypothetical protein